MLTLKRSAHILLILICAATLFSCKKKEPSEKEKKAAATAAKDLKKAPDFTLRKIGSKETVTLSDYQGKVVLLDFWATWCPPCKASIPNLNNLHKKYNQRGFEIIGVNLDRVTSIQDEGKILKFIANFTMKYPNVYIENSMRTMYGGISSIPTMFIVDKDGMLYSSHLGYSPAIEEEIEKTIKELL